MARKDDRKTDRSKTIPRRDFEREIKEPILDPLPDPLKRSIPADFSVSPEFNEIDRFEECPAFEPFAARWQERSHRHYPRAIRTGQCIECCRWETGPGEVGIIVRIGNAIQVLDTSYDPPEDSAPFLGLDPFAFDRVWGAPYAHHAGWHLRVEPARQFQDDWRITTNVGTMPGQGHRELAYWDDGRYQWTALGTPKVRLNVPESTLLSMWFEADIPGPLAQYFTGVAGFLAGNVWNYRENLDARRASRRGCT